MRVIILTRSLLAADDNMAAMFSFQSESSFDERGSLTPCNRYLTPCNMQNSIARLLQGKDLVNGNRLVYKKI